MEIPRPSFRPLRTLSYPHLFSPFTLGTDSVEWRAALLLPRAAPQDHGIPPAPACRLPAPRFLQPGHHLQLRKQGLDSQPMGQHWGVSGGEVLPTGGCHRARSRQLPAPLAGAGGADVSA